MFKIMLATLSATFMSTTAAAAAAPAKPAAIQAAQRAEGAKLAAIFKRSDEASLGRNPMSGFLRGDANAGDRLGDLMSDAYYEGERSAAKADLAALRKIDRSKLGQDDRIFYDAFEFQSKQGIADNSKEIVATTAVRPLNHLVGFHRFYAGFSSGTGAAPFKTLQDYSNGLKRHGEFTKLVDRWVHLYRQGMATGVYESKFMIGKVIAQLDEQIDARPEDSPYYGPVKQLPESFAEADKVRLRKAYLDAIQTQINPAYKRLRDFLKNDYLPEARDTVGLGGMKGGARLYQHLVEATTTLPLTADEIHTIGLKEVARIKAEMEAVRAKLGFAGKPEEFAAHLRTNQALIPPTAEWLRDRYYEVGRKVDRRINEQFSVIPKTKLEIRAYSELQAKGAPGGSYEAGALDGSRPGIFFYNASNLPTRRITGLESIYLHEGAPGHHFQVSLAQENKALPNFLRFGGNTAYLEGWGLYAETLGHDLGLFTDPYQLYGHLQQELGRAFRLVADTGLHAKGWTREQAIEFMDGGGAHEVDRYLAMPGQALGYKIGSLTIQRLRAKAEKALGRAFDVREFHAQILMTGALPLTILEKKIDDWIASKRT
jgi:uncharacterized protein (DUF885 family)